MSMTPTQYIKQVAERNAKRFEENRFKGPIIPELHQIIAEMKDAYEEIDLQTFERHVQQHDYKEVRKAYKQMVKEAHEYYDFRLHHIVPTTEEEKQLKKEARNYHYMFMNEGSTESEHMEWIITSLQNINEPERRTLKPLSEAKMAIFKKYNIDPFKKIYPKQ